jgi:GH15 family glucan-1,4-alpha-glucosidase
MLHAFDSRRLHSPVIRAHRYANHTTTSARDSPPVWCDGDREGDCDVRIEDYGLIGDLQAAALVGRNGSVDWLCLPRFDSPSCFSALLGDESHGRWLLAPSGDVRSSSRRYRPGTLVLETEFETEEGAVRVIDFMPRRGQGPPRLMRIIEGIEGRVPMQMELSLRPD